MIAIQQAATNPLVRTISIICGSQMAKTESLLNVIGACLDDDPGPILYVAPTREVVETLIEPRLMDMIKSSPSLAEGLIGKKSKKTSKIVHGVQCRLAWAGSAAQLAAQPVQLALMDEIDRMGFDIEGEGSPIGLVRARLRTYPNNKLFLTSTPLLGNVTDKFDEATRLSHWEVADAEEVGSTIWRSWQSGTRFEWAWPCPDCGEYFVPRFKLLRWPPKSTPAEAKLTARVKCPHCAYEIEDRFKTAMNRNGRFVAPGQAVDREGTVTPALPQNDHWSFWISGLASPWVPWGQCAEEFLTAVHSGDSTNVQTVINTVFGELFSIGGAAPPWQDVKARGAGYAFGDFPVGPLALTCGVDVQKDRIVYAVRGWAYGLESWLIDYGEHFGNTAEEPVWAALEETLLRTYGGETPETGLPIRRMAIDSGYRPGDTWRRPDHMVYKFCRKWPGRAVPTKGHDEQSKPLHSAEIDVKENGKLIKKGVRLWHIDSNYFKTWVHARLSQPVEATNAQWHLPADISDDYCQQVTAEAKAIRPSGKAQWLRIRRENHLLDCEALNVAAAHMLSLQTLLHPRAKAATKTEADLSPTAAAVAPTAPMPPSARVQPRMWRPPGRNFVNSWRSR